MTLETGQKPCEQVLTRRKVAEGEKAKAGQRLGEKSASPDKRRTPYTVRHADSRKPPRKAKRKGGWKPTRCLDHAAFQQARSDAWTIHNAGYPFTVFGTIMPPAHLPDSEKQKFIRLKLARLGQALERRGQPYVAMVALEKKRGGSLHGHAPIFVSPENLDVVERWADRFDPVPVTYDSSPQVEIHARLVGDAFGDVTAAILYALKQHRFAGPCEKPAHQRFWIPAGDPITGRRASFSKAAQAILRQHAERLSASSAAAIIPALATQAQIAVSPPTSPLSAPPQSPSLPSPSPSLPEAACQPSAIPAPQSPAAAAAPRPMLRVAGSNPLVEGERQLSLFDERPVSRLADFSHGILPRAVACEIEHRRKQLGLPQRQLAEVIGIRQPQYANAIRGHDGLAAWVVSRLRDFLLHGQQQRLAA